MPLDPAADEQVRRRLAAAGIPDGAPLAVMHVSAGNPFRRWPVERFASLASALTALEPSLHVVVTSGPSESHAAELVAIDARLLASGRADRIARCGEFDLVELRALVARARLYIGGDSGPLHIAATTTTPVVALFGPTLPDRSLPWRDPDVPGIGVDVGTLPCRPCHQRRCVPGDFRCLTGITVEAVVEACRKAAKL
jgi:ADP-heptose:LPS heptosyltransferase